GRPAAGAEVCRCLGGRGGSPAGPPPAPSAVEGKRCGGRALHVGSHLATAASGGIANLSGRATRGTDEGGLCRAQGTRRRGCRCPCGDGLPLALPLCSALSGEVRRDPVLG